MAKSKDVSDVESATSSKTPRGSTTPTIPPASFMSLFQFSKGSDILILALGILFSILASATMPAINIVFGDLIDSIASPVNVLDVMRTALVSMCYLALYGFFTFFLGFTLCGWAAGRIANGWRGRFLEAVLRQDATFFDHAERGSVSLMLSDAAFDIQNGLADKFAACIQGIFQFAFGFAVAFYYGPLLSLVLLASTPILGGLITLMILWGSEDGLMGKEAYETAAGIVNETLSNVRTVFSLNAETEMSRRYDSKLKSAEDAAVNQAKKVCFLSACVFSFMFIMYGVGFYYGSILIAKSTENAIKDHPPAPQFLSGESPYSEQHSTYALTFCGEYAADSEAYAVCACGLPWDQLDGIDLEPDCGCSYNRDAADSSSKFSTKGQGCFTGGTTALVFFSILIGAFSAGQIGPGIKALSEARMAAGKIIRVIERRPEIDITQTEGKVRLNKEKVAGEIVMEQMHFRYSPVDHVIAAALATKPKDDGKGDTTVADASDESEDEFPGGRLVFGGCDLTIKAGQTVALVGESGCGKSTVAKLIQRFYDPTNGRITLDGTDLRDIAVPDLRANIGVVSQEPLLFDKSIRDNIRYGRPDATEDEIIRAAKDANAHNFIRQFPDGYDTEVGPGGNKLSGGQKQRVAIARAILRNPAILILDEATSALDNKSEKIVQAALAQLLADGNQRTTIIIAHRLSTVRSADKIVVLGSAEGTSTALTGSVILEQGSHDELMGIENGYYKALVGAGGVTDEVDGSMVQSTSTTDLATFETFRNSPEKISDEVLLQTGDGKKEKVGLREKLFGKKKDAAELAKEKDEKALVKLNKSRVWEYTKPELTYIIIGSIASACKGSIFPLLSLIFSEMIIVWFESDTDELRSISLKWSFFFYGLAVINFICEFTQKYLFERVGERLTKRLRSDTFRGMLRQDITWFEDEKNGVGVLSSRLATDVKYVRLVAGQSTASVLETCAALITGIIIALTASWEIFLVMLAMIPILGTTEMLNMKMLMGSEHDIRGEMTKSSNTLHESINGIREVQAFSLETMVIAEIKSSIFDVIGPESTKAAIAKGLMMGMVQAVMFLVYALAFYFGGEMVDSGRVTFGDFNKALWAMAFAASGLGQAAIFAGDSAKASAALESIFSILDQQSDISSDPWDNDGLADPKVGTPVVRQLPEGRLVQGTANLNGVNFAYPTRKAAKIFDEIDLDIPSGKVVALVGSSGSGKSSVIQLLERFYDPIRYKEEKNDEKTELAVVKEENGVVSIDGEDMKKSDCRWLRSNFGLVGQEPVLFNDTVYNNIALGKEGCTREEIEEAAKSANAYDFIMNLQDGFETMVGNAGSKVSGGQKQRIAIARALVANPKILLLDEATSALDNESEKIVQASLDALVKASGGERTTIIIAHRLSTIRDADVICVLENNGDGSKVVEMGSHDELMNLGQKYKALVEAYDKK